MEAAVDRFDELIAACQTASNMGEIRFDVEGLVDSIMQDLLDDMAGQAPLGQPDEHRTAGPERASIRQHGQSLLASWDENPEVQEKREGISFSVGLDHPTYDEGDEGILEWLRFGTIEHDIPFGAPLVSFWWGDPLPWFPAIPPASDHAPGLFAFANVEHPGTEGFDWIEPLIEDVLPEIETAADLVGEKYAFQVLDELNFLSRRGA